MRNILNIFFISLFLHPFLILAQSETDEMHSDTLSLQIGDTTDQISVDFLEEQTEGFFTDDTPIVRMLDSLYKIRYFNGNTIADTASLNVFGYHSHEVPFFTDSVYIALISELDRETPISLTFNRHVKSFIDLYAFRKRALTSRMLGLAELYFPMFEELLDRYDIPLEMKYLAVVESALNPTAGSHMGAKGLWQFMYGTGKVYQLKVTSLVDDRFDPYKSTEAACQHMLDLYNIYDDWLLVLAAYNSGAGNVNRAIRRTGGIKDYWAIWPFLPKETRGYVPAFIAVNYVMSYAAKHNLYPIDPGIMMNGTDTVSVKELLSFDQLHEMLGITMEDLKFFNPQFKKGIIPATAYNPYVIRIPSEFIGPFLNNETELYAFKTKKGIEKETLMEEIKKISDQSVHIVRSGENLSVIAKRYRVTVKQLQTWNNLRTTNLRIGQKLVVYSAGGPISQPGETPVARSTQSATHIVKRGETLGGLANRYKCSITDLREWNNLRGSTIVIGQKLRVYPPETLAQTSTNNTGKSIVYTVKQGDTLWDIARKYDGVTVEQIKKLNNLGNRTQIRPGQKLRIT